MIPGLKDIFDCNPINNKGCPNPIPRDPGAANFTNLADVLSVLLNIAFYIAVFLTFYFLIWGAFLYIMAQGKKEELAKARSRVGWAIFGLIVVILAYLIAKYAAEFFQPKGGVPF